MKKTLTVNLGGTVFHIDEDAYRLLDDYLRNLKLHFRKQESADEIVEDIENRISELFGEKIGMGVQVINIATVEEVIARMGKPEEFLGEEPDEKEDGATHTTAQDSANKENSNIHRRLFRNPDDKILGGVVGGLAAYFGWDVTILRIILLVLMVCGVGTIIPVYIVCWIVIPEALTAADKLNMRGKAVTVENIGKTVTDGFEKITNGVNNYMRSDEPRTFIQKLGDALVSIAGVFLKVCLVMLLLVFSPLLFVLAIVFIALVIGAVAVAVGGGSALYHVLPSMDWSLFSASPFAVIAASIAGVMLVGIPLASMLYAVLRLIFKWEPMVSGLKMTLLILWVVSLATFVLCFSQMNWSMPYLNDTLFYTTNW